MYYYVGLKQNLSFSDRYSRVILPGLLEILHHFFIGTS